MSNLERVPWMSKDEWYFCRDKLFGENLFMKKKALEHLYIWKVRCTNLPIAVECTLILMEVHLNGCNRNTENEEIFTNTMNYESWYSVAIMRFLNLITDSNVGGKASSSMNQLAKQFEIPDWIVDIRHAVAHGPLLPSLSSLKKAVEKCLNWLYESYWSKDMYEDRLSNQCETNFSSTFLCFEVCLLLKKYLSFAFESVLNVPVSDREKISRVLSKNSDSEMDIVLQEWALQDIYESVLKKLGRHLKKSTDYGKNLVSSILENDQYIFSRDAIKNNELNRTVFNFWSDILFVICDSSICYHFLQELADIVNSPLENSWRQHCAALYLNEILKYITTWKKTNSKIENAENNGGKRKKRKKKSANVGSSNQLSGLNNMKLTEEEILKLIQAVLDKPNQNVKLFLKNLLSLSDSSEFLVKHDLLIALIDAYTGSRLGVHDCVEIDGTSHTVQELMGKPDLTTAEYISKKAVYEMIVEDDKFTTTTTINDSNEWKNTPFGLLPWQVNFQPWLYIYDSE